MGNYYFWPWCQKFLKTMQCFKQWYSPRFSKTALTDVVVIYGTLLRNQGVFDGPQTAPTTACTFNAAAKKHCSARWQRCLTDSGFGLFCCRIYSQIETWDVPGLHEKSNCCEMSVYLPCRKLKRNLWQYHSVCHLWVGGSKGSTACDR